MNKGLFAGIDCGATKVLLQSAIYDNVSNKVFPTKIQKEFLYSDHPKWINDFIPISIDIQRSEYSNNNICLSGEEMIQGEVIIEIIKRIIAEVNNHSVGLCFPGIKTNEGIVVMANGPRIPSLNQRIKKINSIYNDSDCCVLGEWKSTIGKMQQSENCLYIGGGTGIADGIVINGKIIDFNIVHNLKRSWELKLLGGETIESCLSPAGMIERYNQSTGKIISTLLELSKQRDFTDVIKKAQEAFKVLIIDRVQFFKNNNTKIENIIIGQRLGSFLKNDDRSLGKALKSCTDIPIEFSEDRRTAALGAAWLKACS